MKGDSEIGGCSDCKNKGTKICKSCSWKRKKSTGDKEIPDADIESKNDYDYRTGQYQNSEY